MKHAFITASPRYLTTNGLHTIRRFSTHTPLNSHWEEFDRIVSLDEGPQDQVTSEKGKKRPVLPHRQPKLVSNFSSSSASHEEIFKEERSKTMIILDMIERSHTRKRPARSDPLSAESVSVPSVYEAGREGIAGETSSQSCVHSSLPENAPITPVRDSVATSVVSPSTKVAGEVSRHKEGKLRAVPRILRRLSPADRRILQMELKAIAMKIKHGQRVRRQELDKYNRYLVAGALQFLELYDYKEQDEDNSYPPDDDNETSAGFQSLTGKLKQRLAKVLARLEQPHQITSNISSPQEKAKKRERDIDLVVNGGMPQERSSGFLYVKEISKEETGEKEVREQAITQTDSKPKYSFTRRRSPSSYLKKVEGVLEVDSIQNVLEEVKPASEQSPIARLEHNLERVLFNPGVHWLQDPRSRVYNYSPHLKEIPSIEDFAFDQIEPFQPPSSDPDIPILMHEHDKKFAGSTSSLSGMMCHLYFLISGDKRVNISTLSRYFSDTKGTFTSGQRMPTSVLFKWKKDSAGGAGRYYVNGSEGSDGDKNILTWMGMMLEKFLTLPKEAFDKCLKSNPKSSLPERDGKRGAFRFTKTDNFIMRSQLDCHDARLPGSGVFDIKTRACMPIRIDLFNFEENSGYLIRSQHGKYESFEREYFDLVRSAFLKYQFQVRIGGMDGVIVAYHNTKQIFGFQYISLDEMDARLSGGGQETGDRIFKACVRMLENVAEEVVGCFPNQDVRATFETLGESGVMSVFVEPVDETVGETKRPMKLLEVETMSYLDNEPAKPWEAFVDMEKKWSVKWSIIQSSKQTSEVQSLYRATKDRQFRAWSMPTGVDPDDLQEWYENLNFGQLEEGSSAFDPRRFNPQLDPTVLMLRQMAREGRRDSERMMIEEMARPQYVVN